MTLKEIFVKQMVLAMYRYGGREEIVTTDGTISRQIVSEENFGFLAVELMDLLDDYTERVLIEQEKQTK